MSTITRIAIRDDNYKPPPVDEWLDFLMEQRAAVIQELRAIDRVLVKHGRIREETLEKRVR